MIVAIEYPFGSGNSGGDTETILEGVQMVMFVCVCVYDCSEFCGGRAVPFQLPVLSVTTRKT